MADEVSLITGATGFVGGHLVKHLLSRGERVRAFVRKTSQSAELTQKGVELFYGDLKDPASLRQAVQGVQYIYHLGEIMMREKEAGAKNIMATRTLADAAAGQENFHRMVLLSSLTTVSIPEELPATEDTPVDPQRRVNDYYTQYKRQSEQELLKANCDGAVVRAGGIYGPDAEYLRRFISLCLKLRIPLPFPGRRGVKTPFIHVSDLASILHAAAHNTQAAHRVFHAVDDSDGSIDQFLKKLAQEAGIPLKFWYAPFGLQKLLTRFADLLGRPLMQAENFSAIVIYVGFNNTFSNARIKNELGVELIHPNWETGMQDTAKWLRQALS